MRKPFRAGTRKGRHRGCYASSDEEIIARLKLFGKTEAVTERVL